MSRCKSCDSLLSPSEDMELCGKCLSLTRHYELMEIDNRTDVEESILRIFLGEEKPLNVVQIVERRNNEGTQ